MWRGTVAGPIGPDSTPRKADGPVTNNQEVADRRVRDGCLVLLTLELPARADQCRIARRAAACALRDRSIDQDTVQCLLSALGELFANGVQHHPAEANDHLLVSLAAMAGPAGRWILVSVTDSGSGALRPRPQGGQEESGRGLALVRGLGAKITDSAVPTGGYQVTAWVGESQDLRDHVCQCDCLFWGHQGDGTCAWTVPCIEGRASVSAQVCASCAQASEHAAAELAAGVGRESIVVAGTGRMPSC